MRIILSVAILVISGTLCVAQQGPGSNETRAPQPGDGTLSDKMDQYIQKFFDGTITKADLKMIDIRRITEVGDDRLGEAADLLNREVIDALCMRVFQIGDREFLNRLINSNFSCLGAISRNRNIEMDGAMAAEMLERLREETSPENWGREEMKTAMSMADQLSPSDLRGFNAATMKEAIDNGDFLGSASFERTDQKRAMKEKIVGAYGNPDTWNSASILKLSASGMMNNMDRINLKDITLSDLASAMRSSPESFSNMTFDSKTLRMSMGEKLIESRGGADKANTWDVEDIKGIGNFIKSRPSIVKNLDETQLLAALPDLSMDDVPRHEAPAMARKLKSMSEYSDPSSLSKSDIENIGQFIKGVGKKFLSQLPDSAVAAAVDTLKDMELRPEDSKVLLKKLSDAGIFDLNALKGSEFGTISMLAKGLNTDRELDNIPDADMPAMLEQGVGAMEMNKAQARKIIKKAKAGNGGKIGDMAQNLYMMMEHLPRSDMKDLTYDDLGFDCSEDTEVMMMFDEGQARMMFDKIKEELGPVSTSSNFAPSCFNRWGAIAPVGMDRADIMDLAEDENLASIVESMGKYVEYMNDDKRKAVADKIKSKFSLGTTAGANAVTEAELEQLGVFLTKLDDADLENFPESMRPMVARKLGEMNMIKMSRKEMQRMKKFALKNIMRDDTSTVEDRTNAASLDGIDIGNLGSLMCGLEMTDIKKLSTEALETQLEVLSDCLFDNETAKALLDRVKDQIGDFMTSSDMLIAAGGLLEYLSEADLDSIPEDVKSDAMVYIAEKRNTKRENWKLRKTAGYGGDRTDEEAALDREGEMRMMQKMAGAYQRTQDSKRRRRRQSSSVDCDTINSMSDPTSLSAEQLTSVDITDCAGFLGSFDDWDADQLDALVANAKSTFGSVSTWTSNEIQEVGLLVVGLSASEIGDLSLGDSDAVAAISNSRFYSAAQLDAAYEKYKTDMSLSDSALTADDITNLAEFTCGADNAEIESFTSYEDAASTIGRLETCDSTQWDSFAVLAKVTYGSTPSSWTTTNIVAAGNVLGGLTSSEISSFSSDQISAISTNTIQNMPPAKFAGFTVSQISGFSESQANSVTADQQSSLSDDQLDALATAGAVYKINIDDDSVTDPTESSAVAAKVSLLMLSLVALVHW